MTCPYCPHQSFKHDNEGCMKCDCIMSYGAMGKGMTLEERKKEMLRQRLRSIEWDPTYPGPFSAGEAKQKAIKEYEDSKQQDSKQL